MDYDKMDLYYLSIEYKKALRDNDKINLNKIGKVMDRKSEEQKSDIVPPKFNWNN